MNDCFVLFLERAGYGTCYLRVIVQRWLTSSHVSALSPPLFPGGFSQFSQLFPGLCEGKATLAPCCASSSQPCPPVTSPGPTRILPHLYLGCQRDVLNKVGGGRG